MKDWQKKKFGINDKDTSVTESDTEETRIIVLIEPIPSAYLRTKYGVALTHDCSKYMRTVRAWLKPHVGLVADPKEPLEVRYDFYFKKPQYLKNVDNPPHITKPDGSNLYKLMEDCLKPIRKRGQVIGQGVIPDDNQIIKSTICKHWTTKTPKTIITIVRRKGILGPEQQNLLLDQD